MSINGVKPAPQPQPEPVVFTGETNKFYSSTRNGRTTTIYLVDVRKDEVRYKNHPDDKHSSTMSLAKFVKFYQ